MKREAIRQRAKELGFDACHFTTAAPPVHSGEFQQWLAEHRHGEMAWLERNAHKRIEPQNVLPGAKSLICLAVSYAIPDNLGGTSYTSPTNTDTRPTNASQEPPGLGPSNRTSTSGVIARYAQFADYHDVLVEPLKALTSFIDSLEPGMRSLWYVDTGPILERDLAQRAGLGFVGKHTNLISRELGNWFFLAEIITTLEIAPDAPERNRCGTCTRCIGACPTAAITAPFQLDARRCISYLTIELKGSIPVELRPLIGNRIYGCDDCLAACPWNRFAREGRLMQPHARSDLQTPELVELLALDNAAFKQRFAGSPILRTKRRGLLRNVCVALGNTADASALPALETAANDPEPLIAEHARWAIEQIEKR